MSMIEYLNRQTRSLLTAVAIFGVLLLGLIDYLTGPTISFSIAYLLPIFGATWFLGRKTGAWISILSALTWLAADLLWKPSYTFLWIPYWNAAMRLGIFLIVVFLVSMLKTLSDRLLESEERFRHLSGANVEGVIIHEDGKILDANEAYLAMSGFELPEVIARGVFGLTAPESHDLVRKNILSGYERPYEVRCVRKDGSSFPAEVHAKEMTYRGRKVRVAVVRDLTERKQVEVLIHDLLESAPDAMVIVNQRGAIVFVNAQTERIFGYDREELYNQSVEMLLPERFRSKHAEDRGEYFTSPHLRPMGIGLELLGRRKDGSEFPVEVSLSPLRTAQGVLVSSAIRDITQRRQAEEALRRSEEKYRTLFQESKEIIYITTLDGRFLDINPAGIAMLGYSSKEELMKAEYVRGFSFNPEDRDRFKKVLQEQGFAKNFEWVLRKKNGQEVFVSGTVSLLHDDRGNLMGYLGIVRDVTKDRELDRLRQRERELALLASARMQAQEEERRRIAREVHDGLGQLLTAIKFNIEVFEDGVSSKADRMRIAEIRSLAEKAMRESKEISYNLMPSVLIDFGLVPALQLLCDQIARQVKLRVAFQSHGFKERPDPMLEIALYRITQEALNNTIKHAEATEAEVQIIRHPDGIRLMVSDNGKGIQTSLTDRSSAGNNGLGLFSMRERAAAFAGTMRVDAAPGKGTQVIVEIPLTSS